MQMEILTENGTSINLVRFFELSGKQILIYSDNSEGIDVQGHVTIHVSEIKKSDNIVADTVSDLDWENIKNIIKGIVNANKNNQQLPIQDLDYNELDGVRVLGNKALKLMSNYVDLLKLNQPVFEKKIVENIITPAENSANNMEMPNANPNIVAETPVPAINNNVNEAAPSIVETPTTSVFGSTNSINNSIPSIEQQNVQNNEVDYKQLYEEQVEIVNRLQSEVAEYKNKMETLKNIINN